MSLYFMFISLILLVLSHPVVFPLIIPCFCNSLQYTFIKIPKYFLKQFAFSNQALLMIISLKDINIHNFYLLLLFYIFSVIVSFFPFFKLHLLLFLLIDKYWPNLPSMKTYSTVCSTYKKLNKCLITKKKRGNGIF